MSFEKEVLERARTRYEEQLELYHQNQRERQDRIYSDYPRIRDIDRELRMTAAEVMTAAFRNGEDPQLAISRIHDHNMELQEERRQILSYAGYGSSYLSDGPMCRKCSDTGYIGARMCDCLKKLCLEEQKRALTSLLNSRSSSFDDFSLDYYSDLVDSAYGISPRQQMEMVYEACVNYARKFTTHSKSLLMNGSTGLGKTFLSACIAEQVVSNGYSVVYDTAIHVFSCMERQKYGRASEEDLRVTRRILECDLLILDDLGTEMTAAFVSAALYSIINGRLLAEKPTIISTNLNMGELTRRYSPQIASRLMGEYINLVFLGQDIRVLRAQQ